jgi:uncharacterized protein YbjT (DUF2867 family)
VIGATGYVGARLAPRLVERGLEVTCIARSAGDINCWSWGADVDVIEADLAEPQSPDLLAGCTTVVHLVHSMTGATSFSDLDRTIAANVVELAEAAGVERIVYLGGLGQGGDLSDHLDSRQEVGRVFDESTIPTTELRAALLLGSGSASFEMLRSLGELSPVLPVPTSVARTLCQPISIDDALDDLEWAITTEEAHGVVEIGGPDRLTYGDIITTYGDVAGLRRRRLIPVPLVPKAVSAVVLNLIAPLPKTLVRSLVESVDHDVVVDEARDIARLRTDRTPLSVAEAIARALEADADPRSHWTDDLATERPAGLVPADEPWAGMEINEDVRSAQTELSPVEAFRRISSIGGRRGWLVAQPLWELRGFIDRLVPGGVGLRRGRRHPTLLRQNDVLDWWRVADIRVPELLLLEAEMKMPGRGWLEWQVDTDDAGTTQVTQRAIFVPRGLGGRLYWLTLLPFHGFLFPRLLKRILDGDVESVEPVDDPEVRSIAQLVD